MSDSSVWLLVADDRIAHAYVSRGGSSSLLHSIANSAHGTATAGPAEAENVVSFTGNVGTLQDEYPLRDFAFQVMALLYKAAEARACDGIIVVATEEMMEALRRVRPFAVAKLLIAEIVERAPGDIRKAVAANAMHVPDRSHETPNAAAEPCDAPTGMRHYG